MLAIRVSPSYVRFSERKCSGTKRLVACEYSHPSLLLAARDVSRGCIPRLSDWLAKIHCLSCLPRSNLRSGVIFYFFCFFASFARERKK